MKGFTLIELIVVIVLMSIVSLAGTEMIRYTTMAWQKMNSRQAMGNASRVAIERISRELRGALPNSVRLNGDGDCLEFLPVNAAATYRNLPVETSAASFSSIAMGPGQSAASGRVAVYPLSTGLIYDLSSGVISDEATLSAPDINNHVTVTLSAAHQFANHSPLRRFFLVANPVSFCVEGERLFRYSNYGFSSGQPDIPDLPATLPDRALLADGLVPGSTPFGVDSATLVRNAVVKIDMSFSEDGETTRLVHEVQLRNVP